MSSFKLNVTSFILFSNLQSFSSSSVLFVILLLDEYDMLILPRSGQFWTISEIDTIVIFIACGVFMSSFDQNNKRMSTIIM